VQPGVLEAVDATDDPLEDGALISQNV